MDQTALFYSRPSYDYRGGGFPIFAGNRRQRGGGIFGSLKKWFMPAIKSVGKNIVSHGIGLAQDLAADTMAGKNFKDSLISRGKAHAKDIGRHALNEGISAASMIGKGGRRVSRKRKRRAKSMSKRKAKRRRTVKANF